MPVTKTAKRALRVSGQKTLVNKLIRVKLDAAIRIAKKDKDQKAVRTATSLADRAVKKQVIHKNKAAHIKAALAKLAKPQAKAVKPSPKKAKSAKKTK
jgi:ribosomal protein S20